MFQPDVLGHDNHNDNILLSTGIPLLCNFIANSEGPLGTYWRSLSESDQELLVEKWREYGAAQSTDCISSSTFVHHCVGALLSEEETNLINHEVIEPLDDTVHGGERALTPAMIATLSVRLKIDSYSPYHWEKSEDRSCYSSCFPQSGLNNLLSAIRTNALSHPLGRYFSSLDREDRFELQTSWSLKLDAMLEHGSVQSVAELSHLFISNIFGELLTDNVKDILASEVAIGLSVSSENPTWQEALYHEALSKSLFTNARNYSGWKSALYEEDLSAEYFSEHETDGDSDEDKIDPVYERELSEVLSADIKELIIKKPLIRMMGEHGEMLWRVKREVESSDLYPGDPLLVIQGVPNYSVTGLVFLGFYDLGDREQSGCKGVSPNRSTLRDLFSRHGVNNLVQLFNLQEDGDVTFRECVGLLQEQSPTSQLSFGGFPLYAKDDHLVDWVAPNTFDKLTFVLLEKP